MPSPTIPHLPSGGAGSNNKRDSSGDVRSSTNEGRIAASANPLLCLLRKDSIADFAGLFLSFVDPLYQDNDGHSALMLAAAAGNLEALGLLLPVSDVHAIDSLGRSALDHASSPVSKNIIMFYLAFLEQCRLSESIAPAPPGRSEGSCRARL